MSSMDVATWASSEDQYNDIVRNVRVLVDVDRRLPVLPFRVGGHIDVCQYSPAVDGSFGPVLQALANVYGDEFVSVAAFDPEPSVFCDEYGTYGAFRIPARGISDNYWWAMSDESRGELTYVANVLALAGSSGRWAVWAERSWDLAIVMTQHAGGPWLSRGVPFVPAETALADFTEPDYKIPLSDGQRTAFLENIRRMGSGVSK